MLVSLLKEKHSRFPTAMATSLGRSPTNNNGMVLTCTGLDERAQNELYLMAKSMQALEAMEYEQDLPSFTRARLEDKKRWNLMEFETNINGAISRLGEKIEGGLKR